MTCWRLRFLTSPSGTGRPKAQKTLQCGQHQYKTLLPFVCVQASGHPACVWITRGAQPSVGQAASQMVSQSPFLLLLV